MDNKMFCFQCEQAAHCTGCTGSAGVCGKSAETANLQDELTGALIGLARAADGSPGVNEGTWSLIIEALFTTLTNVNFDAAAIRDVTARVKAEKSRLVPDCASCMSPCGHNNDYDVSRLWTADEDIRSLKSLILFGIRGMAAYAYHAMVLGYTDGEVNRFFAKALFAIGEDWGMDDLLPLVLEVGEKNYRCMALLDKANTAVSESQTAYDNAQQNVQDAQSKVDDAYASDPATNAAQSELDAAQSAKKDAAQAALAEVNATLKTAETALATAKSDAESAQDAYDKAHKVVTPSKDTTITVDTPDSANRANRAAVKTSTQAKLGDTGVDVMETAVFTIMAAGTAGATLMLKRRGDGRYGLMARHAK